MVKTSRVLKGYPGIGKVKNFYGLALLFFVIFTFVSAQEFLSPFISDYLKHSGWSGDDIGDYFTVSGIGNFAAVMFLHFFISRTTPKAILLILVCLESLTLLGFYFFSPHLQVFMALGFIQTLCYGMLFIQAGILVNTWADDKRRGFLFSVYGLVICMGSFFGTSMFSLAPLVKMSFLAPIGICLMLIFILATENILSIHLYGKKENSSTKESLIGFWKYAPLVAGSIILCIVSAFFDTGLVDFLPLWDIKRHLSQSYMAAQLSAYNLGGGVLGLGLGYLVDRYSYRVLSLIFAAVLGVGAWSIGYFDNASIVKQVLVYAVLGGVVSTLYTVSNKLVGEKFKDARLSEATTTVHFYAYVFAVLIPQILKWWMHKETTQFFYIPFLAMAVILFVYSAWELAGPRLECFLKKK